MVPEIQIRNGALYADLTPSNFGYPPVTPMCRIPIPYAGMWQKMGQVFVEQAKATCPVDTGYLRNHIGFNADSGGCEFWSDAPYSAYLEYGTSKMKAQPYFESSLMDAMSSFDGAMGAMADEYMSIDMDMYFLTRRGGKEGSLGECYADLDKLDRIIAFMEKENATSAAEAGWAYDLTMLYKAKEELSQRIGELLEIEQQKQQPGLMAFLADMFAMMFIQILMTPIIIFEIMLEDFFGGIDHNHYPSH